MTTNGAMLLLLFVGFVLALTSREIERKDHDTGE